MTQRRPNRRHPHENPPECPRCETDVFVHARRAVTEDQWNCAFCGWSSWLDRSEDRQFVADGGGKPLSHVVCHGCEHEELTADHRGSRRRAKAHAAESGHHVSRGQLMAPKTQHLKCNDCGRTDFDSIDELLEHDCDGDSGTGPKLVADGDGYPEVVDSISAFVLDDLGDEPGAWKVYRASRIAENVDHTPSEVGHYLGRMAGRSGRLEDIDISDRPFDIELWDGTTGTPRRWRIERSPTASSADDDRLVADGGFHSEESAFSRRVSTRGGLEDLLTDIDVAMQNMWVDVREEIAGTGEYHPATVEATISVTGGGYETDGGEREMEKQAQHQMAALSMVSPRGFVLPPERAHDAEYSVGVQIVRVGRVPVTADSAEDARQLVKELEYTEIEQHIDSASRTQSRVYHHSHESEDDDPDTDRGDGVETDGGVKEIEQADPRAVLFEAIETHREDIEEPGAPIGAVVETMLERQTIGLGEVAHALREAAFHGIVYQPSKTTIERVETDGGEAVELDGAFVSGDSAIHEYAPDPPELDPANACAECGQEAHNFRCGGCGLPLCRKHHELGAGFCSDCTGSEDIDSGEGIETDGGIDVDELSEEEIRAVLETPAFQKSLKYRRLAQGIEVLEEDDAIYRQLVATITEQHGQVSTRASVEEVLDLFVEEVKTYTEGMDVVADDDKSQSGQEILKDGLSNTNESIHVPEPEANGGDA